MSYDFDKEKREAVDAGNRALNSLRLAQSNLDSAKNWGFVDMLGGGLISTVVKHSKMYDAKRNMQQAKNDLRDFSRELEDVNMSNNLDIEIGDFLTFADWFFDGLIVDWMVQDRINNASDKVDESIAKVEDILRQLQS